MWFTLQTLVTLIYEPRDFYEKKDMTANINRVITWFIDEPRDITIGIS